MGIYLYPNTKKPAVLEALANVPEGTHARLMEVYARRSEVFDDINALCWSALSVGAELPDYESLFQTERTRFYDEVSADENLNALDNFLALGWGTPNLAAGSLLCNFTGNVLHGKLTGWLRHFQTWLVLRYQEIKLPKSVKVTDLDGLSWG